MMRLSLKAEDQNDSRNKVKEPRDHWERKRRNQTKRTWSSKTWTHRVRTPRESQINTEDGMRGIYIAWISYAWCH